MSVANPAGVATSKNRAGRIKGHCGQTAIIKLRMRHIALLVLLAALPWGLVAQDSSQQQLPTAPSATKYPPPPPAPATTNTQAPAPAPQPPPANKQGGTSAAATQQKSSDQDNNPQSATATDPATSA